MALERGGVGGSECETTTSKFPTTAPACLGEAGRLVFLLAMEDDGESKPPPQVVTECCICLDEDKDAVFIPCGHVCCCESCAKQIQGSSEHRCPICRGNVAQVVKCTLA
mmetsp:Transcript_8619/g.15254  ORF Transcript_8619/g.15254 Transcript_8619/m.15254 type:complete len:109 (-) Transcript_8619:119-445(-)